jgi:hypothetical protein
VFDTTAVDTNVFTIRNRDDGIIKDVTSRFKFSRGEGAVTSGAIDDTIGTRSSIKDTFIGTFTFQPDSSNYFTIVGLAVDEREQSSVNTNEVKMNETIRLKGAGTGRVGGLDATVTGKFYGLWSTRTAVPATNAAPQSGSVSRSRAEKSMVTLPLSRVPVTVAASSKLGTVVEFSRRDPNIIQAGINTSRPVARGVEP